MVFVNKTRMWVVIFIASIQRIHFQTTEHNQMRLIWLFQTIFLKALQQIASLSTIIIFKNMIVIYCIAHCNTQWKYMRFMLL